jgi:hypothetical protein
MQEYGVDSMPTFLLIKGKWNNILDRVKGGSQ